MTEVRPKRVCVSFPQARYAALANRAATNGKTVHQYIIDATYEAMDRDIFAEIDAENEHEREATTPMDDGTLLADCSCGATYSVPQGGDECGALEKARREHIATLAAVQRHRG